jgi:hypothetical protein
MTRNLLPKAQSTDHCLFFIQLQSFLVYKCARPSLCVLPLWLRFQQCLERHHELLYYMKYIYTYHSRCQLIFMHFLCYAKVCQSHLICFLNDYDNDIVISMQYDKHARCSSQSVMGHHVMLGYSSNTVQHRIVHSSLIVQTTVRVSLEMSCYSNVCAALQH